MATVWQFESTLMLVVFFVLLVVKIFAFVNALTHSSEEYQAAGKLTKPAWCLILGIAVVIQLLGVLPFIVNLAFTIAAFVYLADVRPAIRSLYRR